MSEQGRRIATPQERRDNLRTMLSEQEDEILKVFDLLKGDADGEAVRWLAIARTHIQEGFMAAKRSVYEGKRVGDP